MNLKKKIIFGLSVYHKWLVFSHKKRKNQLFQNEVGKLQNEVEKLQNFKV